MGLGDAEQLAMAQIEDCHGGNLVPMAGEVHCHSS
jgi:hypothetical protein